MIGDNAATPMTIHCPHCSTGYLLPDALLGPRGARVRCPRCTQSFVVVRESPPATPGPAPSTVEAGGTGAIDEDPAAIAREVMSALSTRLGQRLAEARASRRVLAEFGPDLMTAFDDFRRRAGIEASPGAFKTELRDKWGVDLLTGAGN